MSDAMSICNCLDFFVSVCVLLSENPPCKMDGLWSCTPRGDPDLPWGERWQLILIAWLQSITTLFFCLKEQHTLLFGTLSKRIKNGKHRSQFLREINFEGSRSSKKLFLLFKGLWFMLIRYNSTFKKVWKFIKIKYQSP